jgi:hypothetical protein
MRAAIYARKSTIRTASPTSTYTSTTAPAGPLLMSEELRLGREAIETAYALKQIDLVTLTN